MKAIDTLEDVRRRAQMIKCVCGYTAGDSMSQMALDIQKLPNPFIHIEDLKVLILNDFKAHKAMCPWLNTRWPEGAEI